MSRKTAKAKTAKAPKSAPTPKAPGFLPEVMTAKVEADLKAKGYLLPEQWPAEARYVTRMGKQDGWKLVQSGSLNPDHPNYHKGATHFPPPVYVAPDGTQFTKATNGSRIALVGLSTKVSPVPLRVLPGTERPAWVVKDLGGSRKAEATEPAHSPAAKQGPPKREATNYAAMTDAELCAWIAEREGYWMTRAYQIEMKQGVKGFRARCRAALEAGPSAEKPTPKPTKVAKVAPSKAKSTEGPAALKALLQIPKPFPKSAQVARKGTGKAKGRTQAA